MTLREHFIINENTVITRSLDKAKKPKKHKRTSKKGKVFWAGKAPAPIEERMTGGKKHITFHANEPKLKDFKKEFGKLANIDAKIKVLEAQAASLKETRREFADRLQPVFNRLNASRIQTGDAVMGLVHVEIPSFPYKALYSEAYKTLTENAQKKLDVIKEKMKKVNAHYRVTYKSEGVDGISDLVGDLNELADMREEINEVLFGTKIEKNYAATKKWKQESQTQWPTVDPDVTTYPEEDLEIIEKPFQSDAQRRWMYSQEPEMAKKWAKETPKGKDLPEKVGK